MIQFEGNKNVLSGQFICILFDYYSVFSWQFHVSVCAKQDRRNRLFPNCLWPPFQSESLCSSFHMKISFHLHVNEN